MIEVSFAIDLADATINNYRFCSEWQQEGQQLNKLRSIVRRAQTIVSNKCKELDSLKRFSWFEAEHEEFYAKKIALCETRSKELQTKFDYQKRNLLLDRIQRCAEIVDLIVPGINFTATLGISAGKIIQCGLLGNQEMKKEKSIHVMKEVAVACTKLAAKAAFDAAFPQVSPCISYAIVNAGEQACGMLSDWSAKNFKKDAVNAAFKIVTTLAIAQSIAFAANRLILQ